MSLKPLFKFAGDLFSLNNFDMFIIKYESSAGKLFDNSVFKDIKITRGMYTEVDSEIDDSGTNFYNDVKIPTTSSEMPILLAEYIPIRHTEITIPQASWNTISIDFLNKKVTKVVPQVKLNKKLTFNLLPDANLQILKHYQDVSKTNYLNIDIVLDTDKQDKVNPSPNVDVKDKEVHPMELEQFIEYVGAIAVADYQNHKILPSITIAQAIKESGCGTSELAVGKYPKTNGYWRLKR